LDERRAEERQEYKRNGGGDGDGRGGDCEGAKRGDEKAT